MQVSFARWWRVGIAFGATLAVAGCNSSNKLDIASWLAQPGATTAAKPTAAPAPKLAAAQPPQLARFHDLHAAEVEALVGDPDFRRVEPPAELWQYRSKYCVVDLFFYGQGDDRRVVHAEARGRDSAQNDDRRCGDGSDVLRSRLRMSAGAG